MEPALVIDEQGHDEGGGDSNADKWPSAHLTDEGEAGIDLNGANQPS